MPLLAILSAATAGCRNEVFVPVEGTFRLTVQSGDIQSAPAGSVLPQPLVVKVIDADGDPIKGIRVAFQIVSGGSVMLDSVGVTAPDGTATGRLQLGSSLDTTIVNVHPVFANQRSVMMRAVATAAPLLLSTSATNGAAGDTLTLRGKGFAALTAPTVLFGTTVAPPLGSVSDSIMRVVVPACLTAGATEVRVSAGTVRTNAIPMTYVMRTAPIVLGLFQGLTVPSDQLAGCLTLIGGGVQYLVVPQYASVGSPLDVIDWHIGASAASAPPTPLVLTLPPSEAQGARMQFESFLRETERRIAPQARAEATSRARDQSFAIAVAAPPQLGSTRGFRVVAALDGSKFTDVNAKLKYIGPHLLLYVDSTGRGFSDADNAALGKLFDTDLYPVDVNAFGSESDVDGNGRVIVLFTPVVNALVNAQDCGRTGYVAGFFYGNDLLTGNANSNKAEIFYAYVPDSLGTYSCPHTAAAVKSLLPDTYIHELQHMISFNQHVLARGGNVEETWLNEGLSHTAEELGSKLYEARYPAPFGRRSPIQLFPDSAGPFIQPQMLNAYVYLNAIRSHSVTSYNNGGSVEERGATWLFLRWLADQKGESVLRALEQTSKTGIANVEAQSGETFGALFGDFGVSLFTDSLVGRPRSVIPARYRFKSRNLRQLMAREATIQTFPNPFPLPVFVFVNGNGLSADMLPGTMTHSILVTSGSPSVAPMVSLRFARKDGSAFAVPLAAQVSIFRLTP